MTNGDTIRRLREKAETQDFTIKGALSIALDTLADILDEQAKQREILEHNPMVRLGNTIARRPITVAIAAVLVLVIINAAGPVLILEILSKIP